MNNPAPLTDSSDQALLALVKLGTTLRAGTRVLVAWEQTQGDESIRSNPGFVTWKVVIPRAYFRENATADAPVKGILTAGSELQGRCVTPSCEWVRLGPPYNDQVEMSISADIGGPAGAPSSKLETAQVEGYVQRRTSSTIVQVANRRPFVVSGLLRNSATSAQLSQFAAESLGNV